MGKPYWSDKLPWDTINLMARGYGLEPEFVAAAIMTESACNPFAMRCEATKVMTETGKHAFVSLWGYFLNPDAFAASVGSTGVTEWIGQLTGWGPMQVQGSVARENGFKGWLSQLCTWDVGIRYGCMHLRTKARIYGTDPANLYAAYNAGSVRKTQGGMFVNQRNVDRFMLHYREVTS